MHPYTFKFSGVNLQDEDKSFSVTVKDLSKITKKEAIAVSIMKWDIARQFPKGIDSEVFRELKGYCGLCEWTYQKHAYDCTKCPLTKHTTACICDNSLYNKHRLALNQKEITEHAEELYNILIKLK